MHPAPRMDALKELIRQVQRKFGPDVVVLHVVADDEEHDPGCDCMDCTEGHEYDEEYDEPDYDPNRAGIPAKSRCEG